MPDLSEIRLEKSRDAEAPAGPSRRRLVLFSGLAIGLGALVIFFSAKLWRTPQNVRVRTEQAVVPTTGNESPRAEPGDIIPLAPLNETDPLVRELVARLSAHPSVAAWLTTDQLIRNFTLTVVNIADGRSPAKHLNKVTPTGPFRALPAKDGVVYVDPRTYQRYDGHADAVAALDARGAARLYATVKPRIQDAAGELGLRDDFDATLKRAILEVLNTPVLDGPVAIRQDPVFWTYADPKLESLSGAQRQLLRMGPRNVRLIQAKLREIAPHLGIVVP